MLTKMTRNSTGVTILLEEQFPRFHGVMWDCGINKCSHGTYVISRRWNAHRAQLIHSSEEHEPCHRLTACGNGIKPVLIFDLPVAGWRCACPPPVSSTSSSRFTLLNLAPSLSAAIALRPASSPGNGPPYLRICRCS